MRLKRILTLTAPLLLYGAARAFAAASGLPADGPVTTFVNFIQTDVAYGLLGTGFAAVALSAAKSTPQAKVLSKPVHLREIVKFKDYKRQPTAKAESKP